MGTNSLFNLFLAADRGGADQPLTAQIAALSKGFQFGNTIVLRERGTPQQASYEFNPRPQAELQSGERGTIGYSFAKPAVRLGTR
jgi:hypothetical protein